MEGSGRGVGTAFKFKRAIILERCLASLGAREGGSGPRAPGIAAWLTCFALGDRRTIPCLCGVACHRKCRASRKQNLLNCDSATATL